MRHASDNVAKRVTVGKPIHRVSSDQPGAADGTQYTGGHARPDQERDQGFNKTFGIMLGKRVGGFKRRLEEIIARVLIVGSELVPIFEALIKAGPDILARISDLDRQIRANAKGHAPVR